MKLFGVGVNWKTPVRIRERLAFSASEAAAMLGRLRQQYTDCEFALLSTCNRTEVYAARTAPSAALDIDDLCQCLANERRLPLSDFYDHLYFHEDAGVALHLFTVAAGLDSLVLGESQILGQVKEAYQIAQEAQALGPNLHALFQRALNVAKRVRTETDIAKGRLSIASAAVDFIQGVFDSFHDKHVLVIGAGKMAELTLTNLRELRPGRVVVTNRSHNRAEELASRFGGTVVPFERLEQALAEADIVISSTGADQPIVRASSFPAIMKMRQQRLMAIVDIAVPRDFEVGIGELDNVLLWNIDDLEKVRARTLRSRAGELNKALKIVDAETQLFEASMALQESGPVIGQLEEEYERILEAELGWLMPQLNGMPEEHQAKIRQFAHRLKNKFLHPPKAALRAQAREGQHHGLIEALRTLFGLSDR